MQQLLREIDQHTRLYRDETGLAWVEDTRLGVGYSAHPNIAETGSILGMNERRYWDKDDKLVRSHGFIYNTSRVCVVDELDEVARQHCLCGGNHDLHFRK